MQLGQKGDNQAKTGGERRLKWDRKFFAEKTGEL
jgi:hypothetical protein